MVMVRLILSRSTYRILFAMGGVEVVAVEPVEEGVIAATLRLSEGMLRFTRGLDGVQSVEVVDTEPE